MKELSQDKTRTSNVPRDACHTGS